MMRIRIVVADQSEARLYDIEHFNSELKLVARLSDPKARLRDREFNSDRPGRVFDRAPPAIGRRGGVGHHATDGERHPHEHEAELFARQIAGELEHALQQNLFRRLILVAAPRFLGQLRAAMSKSVEMSVVAEIHRDLVHATDAVIREHVPQEAFAEVVDSPLSSP